MYRKYLQTTKSSSKCKQREGCLLKKKTEESAEPLGEMESQAQMPGGQAQSSQVGAAQVHGAIAPGACGAVSLLSAPWTF